jgi:tRNA pseudouridine38-40 synthase
VEKRRYALRVAYEGPAFRGFQRQPGLPTVQEALETALASMGVRGAKLDVAARTDAGVSALDQVVSFSARAELDPAELRRAVNASAPPSLVCLDAARVAPSFHARASARSRTYVYLVGAPPPPSLHGWAWSLPDDRAFPGLGAARLDARLPREVLGAIVGSHDFTAFARPGEQKDPVRTVLRAEVVECEWAPLWAVVLEGRGFLRAMVRNLVGTAVTIALGVAPPERMAELLAARGRYRGVRAPGWGLALGAVRYDVRPFGGAPAQDGAGEPCAAAASARR